MSSKTIQKVVFALVVVLLLMASFFAGRMNNEPINVQAQEVPEEEDRAIDGFNCNIDQVAMYANRAHIKCVTPKLVGATNVYFFAVADSSANKMLINRVIAIGLTQMSMNRYVYVQFDTLAANNPPGCLTGDCRKLVGIMGYK